MLGMASQSNENGSVELNVKMWKGASKDKASTGIEVREVPMYNDSSDDEGLSGRMK